MVTYEYPVNGASNETLAILDDGRRCVVNTQYGTVSPLGKHSDTCAQVTRMGGRCDCGLLDGINVIAIVADARKNGLRGEAPQEAPRSAVNIPESKGVCPYCHTYCDGDCQA
jgi:hypothetical protein